MNNNIRKSFQTAMSVISRVAQAILTCSAIGIGLKVSCKNVAPGLFQRVSIHVEVPTVITNNKMIIDENV